MRPASGPADAFEDRLIAALPRLRRFAAALTGSRADADDLAQEACMKALKARDRYDHGAAMESWLYKIAQNIHLNAARSGGVRRAHAEAVRAVSPVGASGAGEAAADLSTVRARIDSLPAEQRTVLLLVGAEGRGYAETAEILDVPIGTVTSRLARARAALKELSDD